jgi:hypothetical protein
MEIKRRVEGGTGFHARSYKNSSGQTDCARCHQEHRAARFALISLDRARFDHGAMTGFTLEGKHREQPCERCHTAAKIAALFRPEIKLKDANRSFLGLRRECASCHQDPHQNQLGTTCTACHAMNAWKPAAKFDHARAAFPLTGRHQQVPCAKCHNRTEPGREGKGQKENAPGTPAPKALLFKGLSFSTCLNCHADQHHGAFQAVKVSGKCEGCHNPGGWKDNRPAGAFDHNVTKFRLVGKHAETACGKCHKESDFARPLAHELCRNCHEDQHKGQFASRQAGSDCSSCHTPKGFKPTLFDLEAHGRSAFPLAGKHSTLRCAECHKPEGREARYKTGKLACASCHTEPHGGEFAAEPFGNRCDLCHTPAGFAATTFSRERHAATKFPLTDRHAEVDCHKCHKPLAPAAPVSGEKASRDARRQYHFASRACNACHTDPHAFNRQTELTCESCHTPQAWKSLRPFDHAGTKFKLDGAHQEAATDCRKCHKPAAQTDGVVSATAPIFSGTSSQCSRCHEAKDAHGSQFSSPEARQRDCSSCHIRTGWNAGGFNHDTTPFALNTAHQKPPCAACHKEQREVNGKPVRVYRGTPAGCLNCHK